MDWASVSRLSRHQDETAEGYLICRDVPIARTGTQIYWENEVPPLQGDAGGRVHVSRDDEEVFNPDSIRSFEGKPLVDNHPYDPVGPDNWSDLTIGYVANVRRGTDVHDDLLLADLVFTTRKGIDAVRRGKRAISVGYNATYEQTSPGLGRQKGIFCNHVALVDEGRCGARCSILDGVAAYNDAFIESEHPRNEEGEFSSGGSGGKKGAAAHHLAATSSGGKHMASTGGELPEHIKAIKIPPGWTHVTYSPDPNADLLATGKDAKGRRQPIYSAAHHMKKGQEKFARVQALTAKFTEIHRKNDEARKSSDPVKANAADVTALVMHTGMRPGSETDTGATEKGYGATTLEGRHVLPDGNGGVKLQFVPGKKHGQTIEMQVSDPSIAAMLLKRKEAAGETGQLFQVSEKQVLAHVHTLGSFKTKDFRTHLGTQTALEMIRKTPEPTNEKEYKRAVKHVATAVSAKLGNTPAIALASYISPVVFANWRQHAGVLTADAAAEYVDDYDLPEAHWGTVGEVLPEVSDDEPDDDDGDDVTEADPDVIAMLGFDPFEIDKVMDSGFVESEHPRNESGEFTSGGGGGREGRFPTSKGEHGLVSRGAAKAVKTVKEFGEEERHIVKEKLGQIPEEHRRKVSHHMRALAKSAPGVMKSKLKEEGHNARHAVGAIVAMASGRKPSSEQFRGLRNFGTRIALSGGALLAGDPTGGAFSHGAAALAQHLGHEVVQHVLAEHALKSMVASGKAVFGRKKKTKDADDELSDEDVALLQQYIEHLADALENFDEVTKDVDYSWDEDIDYRDAGWVEGEHPRVPSGKGGGQFTSGGGGGGGATPSEAGSKASPKAAGGSPKGGGSKGSSTSSPTLAHAYASTDRTRTFAKMVPKPTSERIAKSWIGKAMGEMVTKALHEGHDVEEIAAKLKDIAAKQTDATPASYANRLIQHMEEAHELKPGTLGKAVRKPRGSEGEKAKPDPKPEPAPKPAPPSPRPPVPVPGKVVHTIHSVMAKRQDWRTAERAEHGVSWNHADDATLAVLAHSEKLNDVYYNQGAISHFKPGERIINMNYSPGTMKNVWRHEFGHAIDWQYDPHPDSQTRWGRSQSSLRAESDRIVEAATLIKKVGKHDFARVFDLERDPAKVQEGCKTHGINYAVLLDYSAGDLRRAQSVLNVLGGDHKWIKSSMPQGGEHGDSGLFEDFVGSLTKNKIMRGHPTSYYKDTPEFATAEMFANYVAMVNSKHGSIHKAIYHAIAPKCCKTFDEILYQKGAMRDENAAKLGKTGDGRQTRVGSDAGYTRVYGKVKVRILERFWRPADFDRSQRGTHQRSHEAT